MAKSKKKAATPMMIVATKAKEFAKDQGDINVSGDFVDALNEEVANLVSRAVTRCNLNGRKTVRPSDL